MNALRGLPLPLLLCVTLAQAGTLNATLTDTAGAPLVDAVIFAKPVGTPLPAAKLPAASIDQVNKEFVPRVSVVQTGTTITFPNKDDIRHHVYSFSSPKIFDLKLYSGTPANPVIFDKPGLVVLGCNIHDWMVGYLLVVDTPYFARSDAKGEARIEAPAGEYEVNAWHPRLQGPFLVLKGKPGDTLKFRLPLMATPIGAN